MPDTIQPLVTRRSALWTETSLPGDQCFFEFTTIPPEFSSFRIVAPHRLRQNPIKGYATRGLVRQIVRSEREDVFRIRESSLAPWLPQLEKEWAGGCRNGAELWRRLQAAGFQGSLRVVGEWATRKRRAKQAVPSGTEKSPPARKISLLLTIGRDHLSKADAIRVARIETALPALAKARRLTDRFTDMVRNARGDLLEGWLGEAHDSPIGAFARGLRRDQGTVAAALREPWSNGQAEGQINHLKTLKRQMYGRANIDLLRTRLIDAS
nr:transposase [Roseovarius nitratireducens]